MKKILFVTLLLSCLGVSSFKLVGAASRLNAKNLCFAAKADATVIPYAIKKLGVVDIKWNPERGYMAVTSSEPSYGTRNIPFEDIGFMEKKKKTNIMIYFSSVKEYIRKGNKEEREGSNLYKAILKNFFNNDESLTHLQPPCNRMSFFEAHPIDSDGRPVFLLHLSL